MHVDWKAPAFLIPTPEIEELLLSPAPLPSTQGMLEGAGSLGQSVLRGFRGLISQPVQGAKAQGAVGKWGWNDFLH